MARRDPQNYIRRVPALRHFSRAVLAVGLACNAATTLAATKRYTFEIPDRLPAAYELSFDVNHPGKVAVETRWTGGRILSFKLEGPGSPPVRLQRSGPSPQRIEVPSASLGAAWRLFVRANPGKGSAQVDLTIELPEPVSALAPAKPVAAEDPKDDLEPWARPAVPFPGAKPSLVSVYHGVELFRAAVVGNDGEFAADPCSWHSEFLARMASIRDALASGGLPFSATDRASFARLAAAVRRVDELRTSQEPLIRGPVPADARARIVWRARRGDRIRPLEEDLDALLSDLRGDKCFERLADDVWPSRFAACLIACERYFEEQVRIGDEAANAELARTEWDRYLDAARILEALAAGPGRADSAQPAQSRKPSVP